MDEQSELEPAVPGTAYGRLIKIMMRERGTSLRGLEKSTGLCRKRLSKIIAGSYATKNEEHSIFAALGINRLRAFLAVDHQGNPDAYFGPELETVANFTVQFASHLDEQSAARHRSFEPIREQLITPLVKEVTARVMKHQDLVNERAACFLG